MSTLDDWTGALWAELGLDPKDASQKTVLNLARVAGPASLEGILGAGTGRWRRG